MKLEREVDFRTTAKLVMIFGPLVDVDSLEDH
jgi:hypothetical protein